MVGREGHISCCHFFKDLQTMSVFRKNANYAIARLRFLEDDQDGQSMPSC